MDNTGTYKFNKDTKEWEMVSDRAHGAPDVYFRKEHFEPHFGEPGKPFGQMVRSKRHKKEIMKRLDISEAGDKTRGSFF